jgi:hypothetical protein
MDDLMNELKNSNEKFSEEYLTMMKQYYEKMMKTGDPGMKSGKGITEPDEEGGMIIIPEQNTCLKTIDKHGSKIFINITTHEKVEAPKEEHILEVENQLGVRIPLSLSEKFEDFDNKNQPCQVYDIIINPNVMKKADTDPMLFQFLFQLITSRIQQRFNHEISQEFVKLKNMKYKGKQVRPQRVRVKAGPKIEEVINKKDSAFSMGNNTINPKEINKEINEKGKTPNWNFLIFKNKNFSLKDYEETSVILKQIMNKRYNLDEYKHNKNEENNLLFYDGVNASPRFGRGLVYFLELNMISRVEGINLFINDYEFLIHCGRIYSISLAFPFKIQSEQSYSFFDHSSRLLYIILPFYETDYIQFHVKSEEKAIQQKIQISDDYLYDVLI